MSRVWRVEPYPDTFLTMSLTDNQKKDIYRYMNKGVTGFSGDDVLKKHNDAVVANSIKKHENNLKKRRKKLQDAVEERVDAAMDFAKWLEKGGNANSPAEEYFGRQTVAYLRGEKIVKELIDKAKGIYRLSSLD